MLLLLPGNVTSLARVLKFEPHWYGWLMTPTRTMTKSETLGLRYAVDNECFTKKFDPSRFRRAILRIRDFHGPERCLFVTAPDVVANAQATLAQFAPWAQEIRGMGLPVALAAQDGLENLDVPWDNLDALFVGGSTKWKLSQAAADLMDAARNQGKWTHVGRVNSVSRATSLKFKPDSVDGTAWAKHPEYYAKEWRVWREWLERQGKLF